MLLTFGKYKGQQLENTPKSYQDWLSSQDWFKKDSSIPNKPKRNDNNKYDIVIKYTKEYRLGMAVSNEIVITGLSWEEANIQKDNMNLYHLDDRIDCYYIETSFN